ncbi:hypothetical protein V495_03963 [Pseudogymnoascus sp. VKM F-4514 (FW-929)]|nr:hypothetical protein V495_03963 [Pseudogymnoascus sp. VKM F-4514 (FW-929)]KFY58659.1 hypothetical protein V497_04720 [Pseudogymnoascus sp. VKM F-4516 (FW-969)]
MSCDAGNENCPQEQGEFGHSEIDNQCNNSGEDLNDSLQQNVDSGIDKPRTSGTETGGVANPGADENVHDEPVLVVTPEWQRRSWLLEVSQSAEDNPESVMSINSDNESDGGSWTLEDGPDGQLKSYELQIRNMTSINEALKARARKAEKELSDNEKAFKQQLFDANMDHAESLQAHQDQWDMERAATLKSRQELLRDRNHLAARYHTACVEIKDQTKKINDLDAQLSEYAEVFNQAKAPDGSICTHKQRQETVEGLNRDAEALKEFYRNQIKTLENRVAKKTARLEQGAKEFQDLQQKIQTLGTELSNEQQKCRDVELKLELETKSRMEMDETSKNFEARFREAQTAIEHRDKKIQQIDDTCKSLKAHLDGARQSYAAAMGTARDLDQAHEKLSDKNRKLVKQHRHAIERIVKEHHTVCDSFADKEDALVVEIVILKETMLSMINSCSCDGIQQRAAANIMQEDILDPHASKTALICDKKVTDSQLPGATPRKKVGNWASEALTAIEGAQTEVNKNRLYKGKGIADDIAENRSREAAKTFAAPPGSEFSEMQATFRKGMTEAEMHQGVKIKPTPKAVHLDQQPAQPSRPKLTINTACLDKPQSPKPKLAPNTARSNGQQPPKPKLAPDVVFSDGRPPKPSASSPALAPAPAKARPGNRSKENPPASASCQSTRSFSLRCDTFCGPQKQSAPANITDKVLVSKPGVERSHPIPTAKEQKPAAQDSQK